MRQIHRFVVVKHVEQVEGVTGFGFANGIETAGRPDIDDVGCDERRFCEYRQTGHLGGM
jgi:hypothetical protein